MVAKLELILKPIHWSLVLRAIVFGFSWLFLPFWLFFLIGLYLYLAPLFRPFKLAIPFLIVLVLSLITPAGFLMAIIFSALFYLILGIKDLVFIDRKSAHEILVLLILFLAFLRFFSSYDSWGSPGSILYTFVVGAASFFLSRGFLGGDNFPVLQEAAPRRERDIALGITSLIIWQVSLALLFLPLNFLYQSAILFLAATILLELASGHLDRGLTRQRILTDFSIFFTFLVIILGSAKWSL